MAPKLPAARLRARCRNTTPAGGGEGGDRVPAPSPSFGGATVFWPANSVADEPANSVADEVVRVIQWD
jgi:hypothetical protein